MHSSQGPVNVAMIFYSVQHNDIYRYTYNIAVKIMLQNLDFPYFQWTFTMFTSWCIAANNMNTTTPITKKRYIMYVEIKMIH